MAKPTVQAKLSGQGEPRSEYSYKKGLGLIGAVLLAPIVLWMTDAVVPWGAFLKPFLHLIAPGDPAEFWQFVEGASGLLVLYVAYRGLKALGLTRHDVVTRAQRELAQAAVVQAERFKDILARSAKIDIGKSPVFVKSAEAIDFDEENAEHLKQALAWYQGLPPDVKNSCTNLLNDLEAWCMYFINGVASRDIAYGPCATPFFALVLEYYPVLMIYRKANRISGQFPNTVNLFKHWRAKRSDAEMGKILQRMQERKDQAPELPPEIGTQVPGLD